MGVYVQVGGCCLIGAVYWYNFYPTVSVREHLQDTSCGIAIQAVEEDSRDGGDLEANNNNNPSLAASFSEAGASQGLQGASAASQGLGTKRFSIVASRAGAPLGGFLDTSGVVVLPKESFGGHYVLGGPQGPPPKKGKGAKQFSVVPLSRGGTSSRASQGKSATDVCEDAQPNNNAQASPKSYSLNTKAQVRPKQGY